MSLKRWIAIFWAWFSDNANCKASSTVSWNVWIFFDNVIQKHSKYSYSVNYDIMDIFIFVFDQIYDAQNISFVFLRKSMFQIYLYSYFAQKNICYALYNLLKG